MEHFSSVKAAYYNLAELVCFRHPKVSQPIAHARADICKLKGQLPGIKCRSDDVQSKVVLPAATSPHNKDVLTQGAINKHVGRTDEQFINSLGHVMSCWVEKTASVGGIRKQGLFHSSRAPSLSINDYLKRICTLFRCSDACFVMALVYIDRAGKADPSMTVCDLTVHRLLVTAVMLAAKFHDDLYYSNEHYAKVGGLSLKEVNCLESSMLKMLDWSVCVSTEDYELYHRIVVEAGRSQAKKITLPLLALPGSTAQVPLRKQQRQLCACFGTKVDRSKGHRQ